MFKDKIKTHKMRTVYNCPHFFILSKGNNSGKPMKNPCPNCFVCLCKDEDEKQKLYWLFYGLWQGDYFKPFITGSVIPFIQINNLKQVAETALVKIELKPQEYVKNISSMQLLDKHSNVVQEQLRLIKQAKKILMYKVLK